MFLTVGAAGLGALFYSLFLLDPDHRGDPLPYALVIVTELILILQAFLGMWTILSGGQDARDSTYFHERDRLYSPERSRHGLPPQLWDTHVAGRRVTVDVFITTCGEDPEVIRRTVRAAMHLHGRHRTWVLDDGRSDAVRDVAAGEGARYVRRLSSGGAKAGNINHALTLAKGEFFAVFDADFVPRPEFIEETLPHFHDPDLAFVQTPQAYDNLDTVIARGAGFMQAVFYRFIQPGRNRFNAAFCVGTNVIYRRAAVEDVGGIYTDSKSEDVWTSLMLHENGWRTLFVPDVLAVGEAPDTIEAYSKQQLRWATGGFEILLTHNPLSPRRRLTAEQRIQYLVTSTFYLTGIVPLILLVVPPLQIYFDLAPMTVEASPLTWLLYYAGFYAIQVLLAWHTMGTFRWETLTLAAVSFPIYVKALVNAIRRKDVGWQATGTARGRSPFDFIVPQMLVTLFLALTSVVGILKDLDAGALSLATAWNVTNTMVLLLFVVTAWRESRARRRGDSGADAVVTSQPQRTVVARPDPVGAQPSWARVRGAS